MGAGLEDQEGNYSSSGSTGEGLAVASCGGCCAAFPGSLGWGLTSLSLH